MDIFHRRLPGAVEGKKKIPDIINIDSMIIQEGIASQLRVLRVDEFFPRQITIKMHRLGCSLMT